MYQISSRLMDLATAWQLRYVTCITELKDLFLLRNRISVAV